MSSQPDPEAPLLARKTTLVVRALSDRDAVLARLAQAASADLGNIPPARLFTALLERERKMPTATPEGVAFPHALLPELARRVIVCAKLDPPVSFTGPGGRPVTLAFGAFAPAGQPDEHLRTLSRLARLARTPGLLDAVRAAGDEDALWRTLEPFVATIEGHLPPVS